MFHPLALSLVWPAPHNILDESPDSVLQTLANNTAADQVSAVKNTIINIPASDLSATIEQASKPGPSPSQVRNTMPATSVILTPANTINNDNDANLASIADILLSE